MCVISTMTVAWQMLMRRHVPVSPSRGDHSEENLPNLSALRYWPKSLDAVILPQIPHFSGGSVAPHTEYAPVLSVTFSPSLEDLTEISTMSFAPSPPDSHRRECVCCSEKTHSLVYSHGKRGHPTTHALQGAFSKWNRHTQGLICSFHDSQ